MVYAWHHTPREELARKEPSTVGEEIVTMVQTKTRRHAFFALVSGHTWYFPAFGGSFLSRRGKKNLQKQETRDLRKSYVTGPKDRVSRA
jgi:hypothetical protein